MLEETKKLAEMLEINPNTIENWESTLGLKIKTDDSGVKIYSEDLIAFFKKVKSLILNGYSLESIKEFLAVEIELQNKSQEVTKAFVIEDDEDNKIKTSKNTENITEENLIEVSNEDIIEVPQEDIIEVQQEDNLSADDKFSFYRKALNKNIDQSAMIALFEALLKELKQYAERTVEAEKKVYLLEDFETRVKQEYYELNTDVKQLKVQLEEKEQKLKEYEGQQKRLNLMEVQLKILQIEKNKKKFWEFWK